MLFIPWWLAHIQPRNPEERFLQEPEYPPSMLTARVVTSAMAPEANGTIVPREEQLATQARVEGARRARKAARTEEQHDDRWLVDRMDRKAARRARREARREARRIMNRRRMDAMAAFGKEDLDG